MCDAAGNRTASLLRPLAPPTPATSLAPMLPQRAARPPVRQPRRGRASRAPPGGQVTRTYRACVRRTADDRWC